MLESSKEERKRTEGRNGGPKGEEREKNASEPG